MSPSFRKTLALGCLVACCSWSGVSWSRAEEVLSYTKAQSFRSALRYLRVDQGFEILEKDMESGYLLFSYPPSASRSEDAPKVRGSVEVIERTNATALVVRLPELPSYHERMLIEGLLEKLRRDYGAPPERRAPEPPPETAPSEEEPEPDTPTQP